MIVVQAPVAQKVGYPFSTDKLLSGGKNLSLHLGCSKLG